MSWPLCPAILSVPPPPPFPFFTLVSLSLFFPLCLFSRISIRRGTCHRMLDKILVHIGVGTRDDTMLAIEEKRRTVALLFFLPFYLCYASHAVRRTSAHTHIVRILLALFPRTHIYIYTYIYASEDIPKSCTMTNDHSRVSHLYYAVYLAIKSRSEYFSNYYCSLYRDRARLLPILRAHSRAFQFYAGR